MFSTLPLEDIIELTSGMGINIEATDFETFDMLKNLECARNDLFAKQKVTTQVSQTETVGIDEPNKFPLKLGWLHEEESDAEEFTLVMSKKKARGRKKNIKFSPNLANKRQIQESPGLQNGRDRKNSTLPKTKKTKSKK